MSAKFFIKNLSRNTTLDEIHNLLGEADLIETCRLVKEHDTGLSRGYAFVRMNSDEAAEAAKAKFDGLMLNGHALTIKEIQPKR